MLLEQLSAATGWLADNPVTKMELSICNVRGDFVANSDLQAWTRMLSLATRVCLALGLFGQPRAGTEAADDAAEPALTPKEEAEIRAEEAKLERLLPFAAERLKPLVRDEVLSRRRSGLAVGKFAPKVAPGAAVAKVGTKRGFAGARPGAEGRGRRARGWWPVVGALQRAGLRRSGRHVAQAPLDAGGPPAAAQPCQRVVPLHRAHRARKSRRARARWAGRSAPPTSRGLAGPRAAIG